MTDAALRSAFDRVLAPIPFEVIGKPGHRASERERDNAAIELAAYIVGLLKFDAACNLASYHDELLKRANKVRETQGNGKVVFVSETASKIREAVS